MVESADIIRQVSALAGEYHRLEAQVADTRERLYALLKAGIGAGASYTQMGKAAGISRTRVKQICGDL